MRPDNVYQVRIEQRSRALGDGFLVDPGFVVTSADAVRDAGPAVELRMPGGAGATNNGAGETVTAEVIEVRGEDGLALLAVAKPGFRTLPAPVGPAAALDRPGHAPIPALAVGDQLLRFHRLGAARLRAELNGLTPGDLRPPGRPELGPAAGGDERAALLLDHLRGQARSGRLEPVMTVPGLVTGEDSR